MSGQSSFEISPLCSSSNDVSDNTILVIPGISFFSSLYLTVSLVIRFFNIGNAHFLVNASRHLPSSANVSCGYGQAFSVTLDILGTPFILNSPTF